MNDTDVAAKSSVTSEDGRFVPAPLDGHEDFTRGRCGLPFREQLSVRAAVVGLAGCALITVGSVYVALKLGALPWPIIFAAIVSMSILRLFGKTNINEVNVTHTVMSAGAMVAGGIAFTVPGIWILDPTAHLSAVSVLIASLCGVALGLLFTAFARRRFVVEQRLPYPIGQAAAETMLATGRSTGATRPLLAAMGIAGLWAYLRDWWGAIPSLFLSNVSIPGVSFGIYASPMMLSIGFLVGPVAGTVWLLGGLLGDFVVVVGGSAAGLWTIATGQGIKSSLGIGVMLGCGMGVIVKHTLHLLAHRVNPATDTGASGVHPARPAVDPLAPRWYRAVPVVFALVALLASLALGIDIVASLVMIAGAWLVGLMSSQTVGVSGINPMEVFGVIVLLAARAITGVGGTDAFLIAAVVAVSCGLVGDLMNDYRAGYVLGTSPRAQWWATAMGAVLGAFVATGVLFLLASAYGTGSFGAGKPFIAVQASVVASMVAGVANVPALVVGVVAGCGLYLLGLPVLTLGLGIYLPFYLSLTAGLGALVKLAVTRMPHHSSPEQVEVTGSVIASGLLGGEAFVGVAIALVQVSMGIAAL